MVLSEHAAAAAYDGAGLRDIRRWQAPWQTKERKGRSPLGPGVWAQRDAQGAWGPLRWPVPAVASQAQLGSEAQSVPLSLSPPMGGAGLEGLRLFIGYGRDVDEMLASKRFCEVLDVAPELELRLPHGY